MRRLFSMLRRGAAAAAPPTSPPTSTSTKILPDSEITALSHSDLLAYALRLSHNATGANAAEPNHAANNNNKALNPPTHTRKKRRKEMDWSRYGTRIIALRLSYLGWLHHGFAAQVEEPNTVEAHLFNALKQTRLVRDMSDCSYTRAGRTDVGVSARCQVIGLRVRSNIAPPAEREDEGKANKTNKTNKANSVNELPYAKLLNALLPPSIRVTAWAPVMNADGVVYAYGDEIRPLPQTLSETLSETPLEPDALQMDKMNGIRRPGKEFSARFDALWRAYRYLFLRSDLDLDAMREAAAHFEGAHDFRNFCKIDKNVTNFQRLMYQVKIVAPPPKNQPSEQPTGHPEDVCYIYVRGQAFLWHQVRCMVAVLFQVGRGEQEPCIVRDMLAREGKYKTKPSYRMAHPAPLVLHECHYPQSVVRFPTDKKEERYHETTAAIFAEHSLKAALAKGVLQDDHESNQQHQFTQKQLRAFTLDSFRKHKG